MISDSAVGPLRMKPASNGNLGRIIPLLSKVYTLTKTRKRNPSPRNLESAKKIPKAHRNFEPPGTLSARRALKAFKTQREGFRLDITTKAEAPHSSKVETSFTCHETRMALRTTCYYEGYDKEYHKCYTFITRSVFLRGYSSGKCEEGTTAARCRSM